MNDGNIYKNKNLNKIAISLFLLMFVQIISSVGLIIYNIIDDLDWPFLSANIHGIQFNIGIFEGILIILILSGFFKAYNTMYLIKILGEERQKEIAQGGLRLGEYFRIFSSPIDIISIIIIIISLLR